MELTGRNSLDLMAKAMRKVREDMGFTNVQLMVPFVRTTAEARGVVDRLAADGLKQGDNGLKIIMMCEIPSNCLLADEFLEIFLCWFVDVPTQQFSVPEQEKHTVRNL